MLGQCLVMIMIHTSRRERNRTNELGCFDADYLVCRKRPNTLYLDCFHSFDSEIAFAALNEREVMRCSHSAKHEPRRVCDTCRKYKHKDNVCAEAQLLNRQWDRTEEQVGRSVPKGGPRHRIVPLDGAGSLKLRGTRG